MELKGIDLSEHNIINWNQYCNLDFVILRLDMGMIARDPFKKIWIGPNKWFQTNTYSIQFGVGYPF